MNVTEIVTTQRKGPIDLAIITALRVERDAVLAYLDRCEKVSFDDDVLVYYYGEIDASTAGQPYRVVLTMLTDMGNDEAATAATLIIQRWRPQCVLMVGIAGGVRGEIGLGDVVVGKQSFYYELGKITPTGTQVRGQQFLPDRQLLNRAMNFEDNTWQPAIKVRPPSSAQDYFHPQAYYGPIASGEKVIASRDALDALRNECSKLLAVAMEGSGVARAVLNNPRPPKFLEVRGICDYADESKNDDWHTYAAHAAASYAVAFFRDRPIAPLEAPIPPSLEDMLKTLLERSEPSEDELQIKISKIKNSLNKSDKYFRYEILTGRGEPIALPGAFASQYFYDRDNSDYISIQVFEKFQGALNERPVTMNFQVEFPDSPEGKAAHQDYIDLYELGKPVRIPGAYIKSAKTNFPGQSGQKDGLVCSEIVIQPIVPDVNIPSRLDVLNEEGAILGSIPFMHLSIERFGKKQMLIKNEADSVIRVELTMGADEASFKFRLEPKGLALEDVMEAVKFMKASMAGAKLKLTNLKTKQVLMEVTGQLFLREDLDELEKITSTLIKFKTRLISPAVFPDPNIIDLNDVDTLENLAKDGYREYEVSGVNFSADRKTIQNIADITNPEEVEIRMGPSPGHVQIFDGSIELDLGETYTVFSGDIFNHVDLHEVLRLGPSSGPIEVDIEMPKTPLKMKAYYPELAIMQETNEDIL